MKSLFHAFYWAGTGLWYALRTQRNMQIHTIAMLLALAISSLLRLPWAEIALVVLTCAVVLVAEMINTALEATLNVISPEFHPQVKIAKDVAAGAVLVAAVLAVLVGGCLWLPKLY